MSKPSLFIVFLTVFIDLLGFGIVLPLLPAYAEEFSADAAGWKLGLLMASFSIMQFLFAPVWGRISDTVGRRPVILIGLAGSVIFYAIFGIATTAKSMALLFVARIGAGIAGATISTAQAYIADTTTQEGRSKGMALIGMAFGLGFTLGPLLGFASLWRGDQPGPEAGYVASILSAFAWVLAYWKLPESLGTMHGVPQEKVSPDGTAVPPVTRRGWLDLDGFRAALSVKSIGLLLLAVFICVFAFANFETTISLFLKGQEGGEEVGASEGEGVFHFTFRQILLTFAYIGLVLTLTQGFVVRRLATVVSDGALALSGAILQVIGFLTMIWAVQMQGIVPLFAALGTVVAGFGMLSPSLNGLISRRSDPSRQGQILGVVQSTSALARILGSGLGIPLLKQQLTLPYLVACGGILVSMFLIGWAVRTGRDFE